MSQDSNAFVDFHAFLELALLDIDTVWPLKSRNVHAKNFWRSQSNVSSYYQKLLKLIENGGA